MTTNPTPLWEGDAAPFDGVLLPRRWWLLYPTAPPTIGRAAKMLNSMDESYASLAAGRPLRAGDRVRIGDSIGRVRRILKDIEGFTFIQWDSTEYATSVPTSALTRIGDEDEPVEEERLAGVLDVIPTAKSFDQYPDGYTVTQESHTSDDNVNWGNVAETPQWRDGYTEGKGPGGDIGSSASLSHPGSYAGENHDPIPDPIIAESDES